MAKAEKDLYTGNYKRVLREIKERDTVSMGQKTQYC